MYPVFLQIGNFTVYWYGVMAAVGFLLGCILVQWNRKYAGMTSDQASNTMLIAIVAGVAGARLFYVIQFHEYYEDDLWGIFRIDRGGLVFYGGFLLALFSLLVYCRRAKLDMVRVLDVFAPAIALAHACGRIGCFTKGCCFGRPAEHFWGVVYPAGSAPFLRYGDRALHAVQLYEAAENVLVCALMLVLLRKGRRGIAMSAYLATYGVLRFINETFRGDNPHLAGFTPAQWIGLGMVPAGILLGVWFWRHERTR